MTTTQSQGNSAWSFNDNDTVSSWKNAYPACNKDAARIAPLNIDTGKVSTCHSLCNLSINYNPTTCSVSMVNNIPTVTFLPTCMIKFKNDFLYLRKMTIHNTSMHTIDTASYDLEIMLYHNRNPTSDADGGVIISVLMKAGPDFGNANDFMYQFVNQLPATETTIEQDVDVSNDWNPNMLFPDAKSFFYYDGALPYPPCTQNWTLIIFEEIVPISQSVIDAVTNVLGGYKNIRPISKTPKGTVIFYNSNTSLSPSDNAIQPTSITVSSAAQGQLQALQQQSWLRQNIYVIKGIVLGFILILMIYVAIKLAKYIVNNDILNNFIIRQINKKKMLEGSAAKAEMLKQQGNNFGGAIPGGSEVNNLLSENT